MSGTMICSRVPTNWPHADACLLCGKASLGEALEREELLIIEAEAVVDVRPATPAAKRHGTTRQRMENF